MIIRLRYTKNGKIRFLGHRDVARVLERALRAAGQPVAYSEGFSPRPKVAFGLALSVGYESDNEYLDVHLSERVDLADACCRIAHALPEGLDLIELGEVEPRKTSLMESVTSCDWAITLVTDDIDAVGASVDRLLAADRVAIVRERKGKSVEENIRHDLLSLKVSMNPNTATSLITAELGTEGRSLRPAEFLRALEPQFETRSIRRTNQWISHELTRIEPHEATIARAAHTECVQ